MSVNRPRCHFWGVASMALKQPRGKPPSQRGNRLVKPPRESDEDLNDLRYIALHEAGHAVSAVVLGMELRRVDIKRRPVDGGISVGFTDTGRVSLDDILGKGEDVAMPHLILSLTGPLAEVKENEGALDTGAFKKDYAGAHRISAAVYCEFTKTPQGGEFTVEELERNKDRIDSLCRS